MASEDYQSLARAISSTFNLAERPVALAFVDKAPDGVAQTTAPSPSSCGFWRRGENEVFYAAAPQHFNCAVGSMVMGFELPAEVATELGGLVETMGSWSYLGADEPANIPTVQRPSAGLVYGPLEEFPTDPAVVLMWLTPRQAMLFSEAIGAANWAAPVGRVVGRPACAAIPLAMNDSRPTLSFGCAGMRTFTGMPDDKMLGVVPGDRLRQFVEGLTVVAGANARMQDFYDERQAAI
jgi:uncharacterized protein (DUF169 family)